MGVGISGDFTRDVGFSIKVESRAHCHLVGTYRNLADLESRLPTDINYQIKGSRPYTIGTRDVEGRYHQVGIVELLEKEPVQPQINA